MNDASITSTGKTMSGLFVPEGLQGDDNGNGEDLFIQQVPSPYGVPPYQDADDDAAADGKTRPLQSVLSQEQMVHLLPERNPAFGFKERQASISCRFIRDRVPQAVLDDKWKTIGHGGSRVSANDLTLIMKQPSHPMLDSCVNAVVDERAAELAAQRREAKRKAKAKAKRQSRSWTGSATRLAGRLVKVMDDTFLSITGPAMSWWLSFIHGLPRATNRVLFEKDLRMPVGEDHSLSFLLLHPANTRKKYPTILVRNPYGRLTFFYFFFLFAERGFNVMVQDVRGRGESTGVFDCITDYEDGQATLNWIMSQPWYSGEHGVALLGLSYNGFVLWSTFKEGAPHPAVRAVVPINTTSRLSTINYRDGPLHLELVIRWSAYLWALTHDTCSLFGLARSLGHGLKFLGYFGILDHPTFTKAIRHLPVHEITKRATGVQLNRFSMFMSLPDSGFVKERDNASALRPDLPPAQIHASWYDIFLVDSIYDFTTLVNRGNRTARIIISTDWHVKRYFEYGAVVKMALNHFRRFCRHEQMPYTTKDDRVQAQILRGTKELQWAYLPSWPPAANWTQACLSADGTLSIPTHTIRDPPTKAGGRAYVYCPSDPTPSIGGNGIGFLDAGARDQAKLEKRDNQDLLVYTSEPFKEDMLLMGHPRLVLWVRCLSAGAVSADFVGRLCVVQPNGVSINICDGVKRVLDFTKLPRSRDGQAFKVEVDIYPTAALWAKGTRLRLHVASAGFIRWERNIMGYGYESLIPVRLEVQHAGVATVGGDGSATTLTPDGQAEVEGKSYLYLPVVEAKAVKTGRSVHV